MRRLTFLLCVLLLIFSSLLSAQEEIVPVQNNAISDSLMQIIETRIKSEYGITENSTLIQTAEVMKVELNELKKQLGLDVKNNQLDTMRLRQLGVSVYQVLLAQETIQYGFNTTSTLSHISALYSVPIKKLKSLLSLDSNDISLNQRSIQSLEISPVSVRAALIEFTETLPHTGGNIVLVGILVVFASLLITSLVIMQLRHVNFLTQEKTAKADIRITKSGKLLSAKPNMTNNDIAAVIIALHMFQYQLEERRRLALTFHREKANFWRADGLYAMPNRNFTKK
ncbi:MAG: OadG family protein [Candidatus Cloacimonadaceae bacterium]